MSSPRPRAALAAGVFALACPLAAGCTPDTHVFDESGRGGRIARGDGLGADASALDPGADRQPPAVPAVTVSVIADCIRIRAESSKPVRATARFSAGARAEDRPLGEGASLFDLALRLPGWSVGHEAVVIVEVVDPAGQRASSTPVAFVIPAPPVVALALTEVMANPAGPETSQEYVELRNLGSVPVSLDGLAIADEGGRDPLPPAVLGPDAFALVVGASFDPVGPADVPPREGTPLLRVTGRIGRDGLRQQGEVIQLLAADGGVISSYGGHVDTTKGAWNGRSVHRQPDPGGCDHPQAWTMSPEEATPGW